MGSPDLETVVNWLTQWYGNLLAHPPTKHVAEILISPAVEGEAIAELRSAADRCPTLGRLVDSPGYEPLANRYEPTGCERLQRLAFLVAQHRSRTALPVLLAIFEGHQSAEARIVVGHAIVAIDDRDATTCVASGAVVDSQIRPGWFRLWAAARVALEPSAYVEVADRIASTSHSLPLLCAAVDVAWRSNAGDPRWGDLCMMLLEQRRPHHAALEVLARLHDRRALPLLLDLITRTHTAAGILAIDQLATLLGPDFADVIAPVYERTDHPAAFDSVLRARGGPAGLALIERRKQSG